MNNTDTLVDAALPLQTSFSQTRRNFLITLASAATVSTMGAVPRTLLAGQPPLQSSINEYIKVLRRRGLISTDERTAWSVYDFTTGKKLVSINEDAPLQAASMIKPFVAQAFFYRASEPTVELSYTEKIRRVMERMIRRSNNPATNYLIDLVSQHSWGNGPRDVEKVLKTNAPSIFKQTQIVEKIPRGGRTYLNKASAHDYSRFLYAVWKDRLPYSQEIRNFMALPNRDRINSGVAEIPDETRVYDKTGTTARLIGNMGIVEALGQDGKRYPYTFIAIIEKSNRARRFSRWATARANVIRDISRMVYTDMKTRHNLV